jgi:hypothetical protein
MRKYKNEGHLVMARRVKRKKEEGDIEKRKKLKQG